MKINRSHFLAAAAFGLLAMGACANTATAQARYQGRFTLPEEVRWQGRVMPAGEYTFSLNSVSLSAMLTLQGPSGRLFIPTAGFSDAVTGKKSSLTIQHRGGARFVSELYLAELGVGLCYLVPKAPKQELLAQGPPAIESIRITSLSK
jgi:hypothetical protein